MRMLLPTLNSKRKMLIFHQLMRTFHLIPLTSRTNDASTVPMTGLKSVQFYDNDTLLWSNNSSYSPVPSQYIIAVFSEGFALIDYIAQTAIEVRNDMYFLDSHMIHSHLQNLIPSCVMPLNDRYLLVGTNGHLCVYDTVENQIQTSVAHQNVQHLLPYKACPSGSIVLILLSFSSSTINTALMRFK